MIQHIIFTPEGLPRAFFDGARTDAMPVDLGFVRGDLVAFLAGHRCTDTARADDPAAWVARDPVLPALPAPADIAKAKADALLAAREAAYLDRFDFAARVATFGFVTFQEAAAWAAGNAIPAKLQAIIDTMPEARRGPIILDVLARPILRRNAELMPALAAAFGANDVTMDALFGIAAP